MPAGPPKNEGVRRGLENAPFAQSAASGERCGPGGSRLAARHWLTGRSLLANRPLLAGLVVLLGTGHLLGQEAQSQRLREEFLKEYLPGCRKLIDFYEHLMMEADFQGETRYPQGKCERSRMHFVFKANAPLFLMETHYGENWLKKEPGTVEVRLITRRKGYDIDKLAGGDYHYTHIFVPDVFYLRLGFKEFAFAPYCFRGILLSDFLKMPEVQVTQVRWYQEGGAERVAVHYRQFRGQESGPGWMVFSPQNSWALLQHGRGIENNWIRTLVYENLMEEVPRLKQVQERQIAGGIEGEDLWTIRRLVPGPVPEEEFTPAAYGLAEPVERSSVFFLLFWLALALLLLTILARLLHYLWKKQRTLPAA
jgi:hypothetical protein